MNIAIITGASSGLGQEFTIQLRDYFLNIDQIWLIARRKDKLMSLSKLIKVETKVIAIDLTDSIDLLCVKKMLEVEDPVIRVLINAAGAGIIGKFEVTTMKEQINMLDLNCIALTKLTHICIPYMKAKSRIIQIASSSAFLPQPNFAIYAATKSFVLSFSQGLGEELREKEIYVTAVCPGPVDTEFFQNAEKYSSRIKAKDLTMSQAPDVVEHALKASVRKKPVAIYGIYMKSFQVITKFLPHNTILKTMRRIFKDEIN